MPRRSSIVSMFVCAPLLVAAGCSSGSPTGSEVVASSTPTNGGLNGVTRHWYKEVCPMTARPGEAKCFSHVVTDQNGKILAATTPQGYGPSDLQSAYKLPTTGAAGATVAHRRRAGRSERRSRPRRLPRAVRPPACTTANGCFKKVNQNGVQGSYPTADTGWGGEISLDLDMVSAACPELQDHPRRGEQRQHGRPRRRRERGRGARRDRHQQQLRRRGGLDDRRGVAEYFNHPGVLITASAGDGGYGAELPGDLAVRPRPSAARRSRRRPARRAAGPRRRGPSGGSGCSAYIAEAHLPDGHGLHNRMEADVVGESPTRTPASPSTTRTAATGGGGRSYGGTSARVAARRVDLRADRNAPAPTPQFPYANTVALLRRDERRERHVQPVVSVHRGRRLRRPDRLGNAQRVRLGLVERK